MKIKDHDGIDELRRLARLKAYAPIRDRLGAVIGALEGGTAAAIADRLGYTDRWVKTWAYRYRDEGLAGLWDRPRSGQPAKLDREREEAFKRRVLDGPGEEEAEAAWRGRDLRRVLAEEFDAEYRSLQGVYGLLHRLGLSWLCPRPVHRKNDPEAMEQWLDRAPFLSGK